MSTLPSLFSSIVRGERDAPLTAQDLSDAIGETCIRSYGYGGIQFLTAKAEKMIAAAITAAEQAQLQRDAGSICVMCAEPEKWEQAEWETDGGYIHKSKRKRKAEPAWCDATLLWSALAEREA
jgi:hypothetical protein